MGGQGKEGEKRRGKGGVGGEKEGRRSGTVWCSHMTFLHDAPV